MNTGRSITARSLSFDSGREAMIQSPFVHAEVLFYIAAIAPTPRLLSPLGRLRLLSVQQRGLGA
jgi:hypothetical protein